MSKGGTTTSTSSIDPQIKEAFLANFQQAQRVAGALPVQQFAGYNPMYQAGEEALVNAGLAGPGISGTDLAAQMAAYGGVYQPAQVQATRANLGFGTSQNVASPMAASPMAARTSSFAGPAVLPQQFNAGQNVVPPMGGSTSSFSGLGSPQGNRQIPQEMIDANARASALTALEAPTNYGGAGNMIEMMKSQQDGGFNGQPLGASGQMVQPSVNNVIGSGNTSPMDIYSPQVSPQQGGGNTNSYGGFGGPAVMPQQGGGPVPAASSAMPTSGGYAASPQQGQFGNMPQQGFASFQPPQGYGQQVQQIGSIADYMNPYTSQVRANALADLESSRQAAIQQTGERAAAARAFGGSRQGVAESLTNLGFARQAGTLGTQLNESAFNNAMALQQADIARQQQVDLANQQAGLQGAQLRTSAAGQLGNLAAQQQALRLGGAQAVMGAGGARQALDQQQMDAIRNIGLQRLVVVQSSLGAQPANLGMQSTTPQYSNPASSALGGALAGGKLFGVPGAIGGGILGLLAGG
jgi:hypothetical protein